MKLSRFGTLFLLLLVAFGFMFNAGDAYAGKEELLKFMADQHLKCFRKFKKDEKKCLQLEETKGKKAAGKCFKVAYKAWDRCLDPEALKINAKAEFAGKLLAKREKEQDKCTETGKECSDKCLGKKSGKEVLKCIKKCEKEAEQCLKDANKKYKKKIKKLEEL